MKNLCIICILAIFCLTAGSLEAKNLYVDNSSGDDGVSYANNDSNNPWRTIGRAAWGSTSRNNPNPSQAARAGDTVYIASGTYNDSGGYDGRSPLYDPVNSGSSGNYITFQAVGTVELTTSGSNRSPLIGSHFSQYIKWDGFTINQANINYRAGNGIVQVWGNYTTISNCDIIGIPTTYSWGDDQHNAILAQGTEGGSDLEGLVIENNQLHGFSGGSGRNDSAITIYWIGDAVIQNNEIYSNSTGIYAKSSNGDSDRVIIRYNIFHNNDGDAIAVQSHSNWRVYQNIFRDNGSGFCFMPTQYQTGTNKPRFINVINNTFHNNTRGIFWKYWDWINNCRVQNNLFTNNTYNIYTQIPVSYMTPNEVAFNYNAYDDYSTHGVYNESPTFSFSDWQGSTFLSQDQNSWNNIDPLYANESNNNFLLQPSSPFNSGGPQNGVDMLDLDNDGDSNDPIGLGVYITGDEIIGNTSGDYNPPDNSDTPVAVVDPPVVPSNLRIISN